MLAGRRALWCIAVLAAMGCNLDNEGDAPPRGLLYFPNALALSAHDANTPASHLLIGNSDFDLRYRSGSVQSYSLDAITAAMSQPSCTPGPECLLDPHPALADEASVGAFTTALGMSSDGSALFVATRTDDTLGVLGLGPDGRFVSCGGFACNAALAPNAALRNKPLAWPGNPVSVIAGPLSTWAAPGQTLTGDYVLVAHRTGAVSLFVYRPGAGGAGELLMTDVLEGLPTVLTEMAYDPTSHLVHLSIAGGSAIKTLARVGVVIPQSDGSADPALSARVYDAGTVQFAGVASGNDSRDLVFSQAVPSAGAEVAGPRALVLSSYPSALLVVDVDPKRNPSNVARVESTIALGVGAQRIVTGVVGGRALAVVACFDARQLFIVDLNTMLVRSVVPNLSGPFDLALDEARKLVYLTDFRSSVIRVVDLGPAVEEPTGSGRPVRVIATLGVPQVLPELQ